MAQNGFDRIAQLAKGLVVLGDLKIGIIAETSFALSFELNPPIAPTGDVDVDLAIGIGQAHVAGVERGSFFQLNIFQSTNAIAKKT